jgi:hypothetical protein
MYIVLGILYESSIHPITILSTLPSATVGALLALWLTGRPLDMIAIIGVILLIGLVKKNGIMMVDFALEAARTRGLSPRDAIHQAALLRFRPILMTTLAALFGALPLMFSSGSGAELRQPLGLVMVGGLLVSQVLTLFTTPVVYLYFDRLRQRMEAKRKAPVRVAGKLEAARGHACSEAAEAQQAALGQDALAEHQLGELPGAHVQPHTAETTVPEHWDFEEEAVVAESNYLDGSIDCPPEADEATQHTAQLKIRIPVEEYPGYNFIGRLLGPRGATLKQLETQSKCRLYIRGRGSLR